MLSERFKALADAHDAAWADYNAATCGPEGMVPLRDAIYATRVRLEDFMVTHRAALLAAVELAEAVEAYEDAVECCDCDPEDWRCPHGLTSKGKERDAALTAYRSAVKKEGE